MLAGGGGMVAYAGTSDMREVEKMAQEGNAKMAELIDAFHYQVGKEIGATAAAMHGKVDQIILTGGIAYGKKTVDAITDLVGSDRSDHRLSRRGRAAGAGTGRVARSERRRAGYEILIAAKKQDGL